MSTKFCKQQTHSNSFVMFNNYAYVKPGTRCGWYSEYHPQRVPEEPGN